MLRRGVEARRQLLADIDAQAAGQTTMLGGLESELAENRVLAGLTTVFGPGVSITLADGKPSSQTDAPEVAIIHDYDLVDVLNSLWAAGAEAVAVNGERIVFGSYVYCVGSTIIVGDRRLSPPLEILAIGDADSLIAFLTQDPELEGLRARAREGSVLFRYEKRADVTAPAYQGALTHRYARAGD